MAFTQTDIDTLKAAIVSYSGAVRIKFSDREVHLSTPAEMRELLAMMERDVAASANVPRTRYATTSKGL